MKAFDHKTETWIEVAGSLPASTLESLGVASPMGGRKTAKLESSTCRPTALQDIVHAAEAAVSLHREGKIVAALDALDDLTRATADLCSLVEECIKICSCGRGYTISEWHKLQLVGHSEGLEMRNCWCHSTLAVEMVP